MYICTYVRCAVVPLYLVLRNYSVLVLAQYMDVRACMRAYGYREGSAVVNEKERFFLGFFCCLEMGNFLKGRRGNNLLEPRPP